MSSKTHAVKRQARPSTVNGPKRTDSGDDELLPLIEAARAAWLDAALRAYEDGGIRGLCGEGRWEYAMDAVRRVDLHALTVRQARPHTGAARTMLQVKRVYAPHEEADGLRILVDRLWPRGLTRLEAALDDWVKHLAPSPALRRWFGHDASRWHEFQQRFIGELDAKAEEVRAFADRLRGHRATLLFAARDVDHNHAVALYDHLTSRYGV